MIIYFANEWVLYLILHFNFLSFGNLFARLTQINLVYLLGSFTLCLFYLMSILYHDQRVKANPETGKTDIYSVTFVTFVCAQKVTPEGVTFCCFRKFPQGLKSQTHLCKLHRGQILQRCKGMTGSSQTQILLEKDCL